MIKVNGMIYITTSGYLYLQGLGPLLGPRSQSPGLGPQFLFTSPGPQFVFTGPDPQFVFTSSTRPEFGYIDLVSPICIYWPWTTICTHTGC